MAKNSRPAGIRKIAYFDENQIEWLSKQFKERRLDQRLNQSDLATVLNININALVDFEKKCIIPIGYDNRRILVNYALDGSIYK